jgi:hypothetical protein
MKKPSAPRLTPSQHVAASVAKTLSEGGRRLPPYVLDARHADALAFLEGLPDFAPNTSQVLRRALRAAAEANGWSDPAKTNC